VLKTAWADRSAEDRSLCMTLFVPIGAKASTEKVKNSERPWVQRHLLRRQARKTRPKARLRRMQRLPRALKGFWHAAFWKKAEASKRLLKIPLGPYNSSHQVQSLKVSLCINIMLDWKLHRVGHFLGDRGDGW
jgi:hypothetical protein